MARCGCNSFPVCSCVVTGDEVTTSVEGSGTGITPYAITVLGYPNPRPNGTAWMATQQILTDGVAAFVQYDGGIGAPINYPSSMWDAGDPTKLTAPEDGLYLICSSFRTDDTGGFDSTSAGTQRAHQEIRLNGVTIAARDNGFKQPATPVENGNYTLTTIAHLDSGDFVQAVVQLNGMIDALTDPALNRASLQLRWMGL